MRLAVAAATLSLAAVVPGPNAFAAGSPGRYAFTDDAPSVAGATSTTDAERLEPGRTYKSSLPRNGKLYYRLDLDATSTAYVSATAVPAAGTTVAATDGLRTSVQDAHGASCSFQAARFGASRSPHPVAAWGAREASPGRTLCQGAGTYYVLIERVGADGSSTDTWPLELAAFSEPPLEHTGATAAPESWNSASPEPVTGQAVERAGGAGFAGASAIGPGVWRTRIRPGETLFYKVPVDWGQQPNATAELGSASEGGGYVSGALTLSLYNPVRGHVEEAYAGYRGRQASAGLAPLPPVDHANRHGFADQVKSLRFAGFHYLVVHLAAQTAERFGEGPYGLTLRVRVDGTVRPGPDYAGRSEPGQLFEVTARDRAAATPAGAAGGTVALRVLAAGGIGAGTVLLAVLGVWTMAARRRTASSDASGSSGAL
ncbi:hypothetical protein C1I97_32645 [Streptomyces sp. NTH33]|uniref:hypothetical protein n=1 Tax=Streptomyces sp. NTH33 TaxID=1735453 RepID=UPI000DAAA9C5|nr:hypothetical protein [Streptomyces sp. NTH33]PZG87546.1 hypothetical protein C1I97_32645 [Streptomyces sp. NTH33]